MEAADSWISPPLIICVLVEIRCYTMESTFSSMSAKSFPFLCLQSRSLLRN